MSLKRELSNAETEISGSRAIQIHPSPSDVDERYFEGALHSTYCAIIGGALLCVLGATLACLNSQVALSIFLSLVSISIFAIGSHGVRRKDKTSLLVFLSVCFVAGLYSSVRLSMTTMLFVMAILGRVQPVNQQSQVVDNVSRGKLLALLGSDVLGSFSLLVFWIVAGYTVYKCINLITERKNRSIQRHLNVIRDTIDVNGVQLASRPSSNSSSAVLKV
eukprot:Blabericola_migrator_1__12078@NODE_743_length_6671_cov_113_057692_g533_i0_p4_GENE_NODE_743_length_6671_cov_113_057692_g533_i0NODE_743_length_6671_cov_113_057692_g533_i0_p4_ORF_typecomplete_len219_score41_97DUF872/PF05915_12/4_4_NODE_743_length_6671_cov_113_057692_g533_i031053761